MSLLILLIAAFLLLYIYKFTWVKFQTNKLLHLSIGLLAMLILFFVPLIFIVNVTSMLYPDRWGEANGFFEKLILLSSNLATLPTFYAREFSNRWLLYVCLFCLFETKSRRN
ncbi:hypothetical protein LSPH24S_09549 [Lysinibacillus sphaericus]